MTLVLHTPVLVIERIVTQDSDVPIP
jgi:hypothetical protein